jgi:lipopolysaccharide transport system permease protein/teichoic acid transport system permease protein
VPSSFRSSSVRPGPLALIRLGIRETLSRRRLIAYLVRADLKKSGADTLLGNLWWILDPLLQMLVYWLLVGVILGRGSVEAYPLFIFAAILPWKWFESTVRDGVQSVASQERLIKQIYFPKVVLPVAAALSGVANFAFGLIPLFGMMLILYSSHISAWMLLIPVIAAVQLLFSLGIAIAVSAVNVFYRDVGNLTRHLLRFWFYLSPTLYGMDTVERISGKHELVGLWYTLNPWTHLLNSYRDVIYYGQAPDWVGLGAVAAVSAILLALAIVLFKRVEPTFAKVL